MTACLRVALAALALALAVAARPEEPRGFHDDPGLVGPLRVGVRGLVLLADGRAVEGRIVLLHGNVVALRVDDPRPARHTAPARVVQLDLAQVRGFASLSESAADEDAPPLVRVVLSDGSVLGGTLVERTPERLVLGGDRGPRVLETAGIRAIHVVVRVGLPIRTEQRHLEMPSAVMPASGNLRFAVVEGAHLLATWAPTDFAVLELGTALPYFQARHEAANVQLAVRAGVPLLPWLSASGGLHLESSRTGRHAARLSGGVTASADRVTATLYAGPAFVGASGLAALGDVAWGAALSARLVRRVELVAEVWTAAPYGFGNGTLLAGAARYRGDRFALDVGVARGKAERVVPWIGVAADLLGQ